MSLHQPSSHFRLALLRHKGDSLMRLLSLDVIKFQPNDPIGEMQILGLEGPVSFYLQQIIIGELVVVKCTGNIIGGKPTIIGPVEKYKQDRSRSVLGISDINWKQKHLPAEEWYTWSNDRKEWKKQSYLNQFYANGFFQR